MSGERIQSFIFELLWSLNRMILKMEKYMVLVKALKKRIIIYSLAFLVEVVLKVTVITHYFNLTMIIILSLKISFFPPGVI